MTKKEVALIQAKVDQFEKWEMEEVELARRCLDADEKKEHYLEATKCGSSATALRNILIELGF